MLDLRNINDADVKQYLVMLLEDATVDGDRWRVLGAANHLADVYSFTSTKTYPRPDHPEERKRLPLSYLLAAILVSLRTTLENEQRAMNRLIDRYPSESELLVATIDDIAECIAPAGMAISKATRIVTCFEQIRGLEGGLPALAHMNRQDARSFLLSLPGFGPKAADCMLSIGLGHASMVVDVNVFRLSAALFAFDWWQGASYANLAQVQTVKNRLDLAVGDDVFLCQIVHTLFLLEGKARRTTHPVGSCRLSGYCLACASVPELTLF